MSLSSWWRRLMQTGDLESEKSKGARWKRLPRTFQARVEQLEDRIVPAGPTRLFLNVGPSITNIAVARSTTVPVFIDVDTLNGGAGGIMSASLYVKYDPAVLSINETTV